MPLIREPNRILMRKIKTAIGYASNHVKILFSLDKSFDFRSTIQSHDNSGNERDLAIARMRLLSIHDDIILHDGTEEASINPRKTRNTNGGTVPDGQRLHVAPLHIEQKSTKTFKADMRIKTSFGNGSTRNTDDTDN